jgi:aminopeptidase S
VESPITTTGCAGNASATATVEVHILHTYIGDLVVTLVAPDGSTYPLHNRAGGSTDNIDQTYTLNLSSEQRNGTWKLRVQDASALDIGRIDSWTLSL